MKMNWIKRVFCLMLSAVLLLGNVPVAAFAEETGTLPPEETVEEVTEATTEPVEVTEPETSEPTEPEFTEPETSEPEETTEPETSEPTEDTTESTEPEVIEVVSEEETVIPDAEGWPTDEELFSIYADGLFYGNMPATFGTAAGETLTGNTKLAYDILKPHIQAIARGDRTSTSVKIGYDFGLGSDYTVEEEVLFVGTEFDLSALMYALLADMPYELYWFDKTSGMGNSAFAVNNQLQWTISFTVAGNYAPGGTVGGYTADTAKTGAAATAAANAASVVAVAAGLSDYEKLVYYKEYICGAVDYDWTAYFASEEDPTYFKTHSDSWQLVHVFDGDSNTRVVCEGYSKAFQYLCDMTDFDGDVVCYSVTGDMATVDSVGGHMWNIVTFNGVPYMADITNSDDGSVGENGGLFLVGGTMTDGGYSFTISGSPVAYYYDGETQLLWANEGILTLSTEAEYEPPVDPSDCTHAFSGGSCTKCGILGGTCGTGVYWTLDEEGLLTIYGSGSMTNYSKEYSSEGAAPWYNHRTSVKQVIIETGVTSIGNYAFYNCSDLTDIVIPGSITSIGQAAFYGCSGLMEVTMPEGVTTIDAYAFYKCSSLTKVNIPDGVTVISSGVFAGCTSLPSIEIPEAVTQIQFRAFDGCSNLAEIEIPENVTSIGESAFANCTILQEITIPAKVTAIGIAAFKDSSNLKEIFFLGDAPNFLPYSSSTYYGYSYDNFSGVTATAYYPAGNATWTADVMQDYGGTITWVETKCEHRFSGGSCIKCGILGGTCGTGVYWTLDEEGLLTIYGSGSMTNFTKEASVPWYSSRDTVKKAVIEAGVTNIGKYAFTDCVNLAEVTIPEGITAIADYAFDGCSSLTEITIPDTVTSIGMYGFAGTGLKSVRLPEKLTSISGMLFMGCGDLTEVKIPEGVTSIGSYAFSGCSSLTDITIPAGVTTISIYAFHGCSSLADITIPAGVTTISIYAFYGCSSLKSIAIPKGVTSIADYAFAECTALEEISIPASVTKIGTKAFYNCTSLADAVLPSGLTSIGTYAFYNCDALTEVTIPKGVATISENAFENCSGLTDLTIAYGVTTIGNYAFRSCGKLKSITIPSSVTSIGKSALASYNKVQEVIFEGGAPTIDSTAFQNATTTAFYPSENTTWTAAKRQNYGGTTTWIGYIRSNGEKIIARGSCKDNLRWSLTVDGTLTVSGNGKMNTSALLDMPWYDYRHLIKKAVFEEGVTGIGSYAFYECKNMTEIQIPSTVTSIGNEVFFGCTGLTSITIPDTVESLGSSAFSCCTNLSEIHLSEKITSIGTYTFDRCSSLTKIELPAGITSIGKGAFNQCTKLEEIVLPEGITEIPEDGFFYCESLKSIVIPEGVKTIGNWAFTNCTQLEQITFEGNCPQFAQKTFLNTTTTAYYPANNDTWTEDKLQDYGGTITWVAYEPEPEEVIGTVTKGDWTMSLDQVIYLNYYPTLTGWSEDYDFANRGGVVVWTGSSAPSNRYEIEVGKPNTLNISGMHQNAEGKWYVQTQDIFAKNLGDRVYIRPYVMTAEGEYVYQNGAPYYSPAQYCYDILKDPNGNTDTKNVCAALLEYGAAAQEYFGYKTDNLVTTIPSSYKNIDLSSYADILTYQSSYLNPIAVTDHVKNIAGTLSGTRSGITLNTPTLALEGAIRLSESITVNASVIDAAKIQKVEMLFWTENQIAALDTLAYENLNSGNTWFCQMEDLGNGTYGAKSDFILAKNMGQMIYYSCRITMTDGTVYRSGLGYYNVEAFIGDTLKNPASRAAEVCRRLAVYGEMARIRFA